MINSYHTRVWSPPFSTPLPLSFSLVIFFHTTVYLRHRLRDICLCCHHSVKKQHLMQDPKLIQWSQPSHCANKKDPVSCLPTLSPMAVQHRGWDRWVLHAYADFRGDVWCWEMPSQLYTPTATCIISTSMFWYSWVSYLMRTTPESHSWDHLFKEGMVGMVRGSHYSNKLELWSSVLRSRPRSLMFKPPLCCSDS